MIDCIAGTAQARTLNGWFTHESIASGDEIQEKSIALKVVGSFCCTARTRSDDMCSVKLFVFFVLVFCSICRITPSKRAVLDCIH